MLDKRLFDPKRLTQADISAFQTRYKDDPVRFSSEVLGIDLDDNQVEIALAFRDNDYTAVSSGRGIGKTIIDAVLALWVLCTRRAARVLMLANTDAQSRSVMWPPLISILRASAVSSWFESTTESVHFKGEPEFAFIKRVSWSENSVESVSGFHGKHMAYFLDEASKMPNV